ncbi:MAG: ATP-binding protein [Nitrospiraceae bacterium]|nr:ATP-binding protein [Nitrospiraceae bacterium]
MKTNIFLFGLVLFIISLIITLNMFFQESYQSEMAEQFNRQQLLIAKSIAKGIEGDMQHIDAETLSLARLLGEGRLSGRSIEEAVYTAYVELSEDTDVAIKIIDGTGKMIYSSRGEKLSPADGELLRTSASVPPGKVVYLDRLAQERKLVLLTPIVRPKGGASGLLILELSINTISKKFLAPIKAGIRGHAWMMSGNGTLLYHPTQPKMVGKNLYKADKSCFDCHKSFDVERKILESGDIGFSSYIAPYGEDKLIAFSRVKVSDLSWIVCVSIPYSEVTFSMRRSMKLHSLLVISIFIATVTGAFAIVTINRQRVKAEERAKYLETQKLLEKEILQTKDYLENLLESTESKIMVLDRDMIIHTVNSAHARLCGRKKEEIVGRNFFDVFSMSEVDRKTGALRKVLEQCLEGRSHRLSNYGYARDGQTLFLNINVNPLVLHGEVAGIILSSSDVTEEVGLKTKIQDYALRLEEMVVSRTDELQGEKEKLDAIVSAIEGGLCVLDNDEAKVIWANRTLLEWLGQESFEEVGMDTIYGGSGIHRAIVDDKMLREVIYHDYGRKKGYFQITSTPLIAPHAHRQTLVLIQDITDIKKMEDRMMQSEKLSALARISAGIAHEIGNPLTSISSYVQILRELDHDEFTKESLDTVAKHINRIADIVRQMSGFSKMRTSDLRHHDARALVDLTLDLVKYDKRMKGIAINVDIPETMPPVRVDETQMIQVLMNIILNAADAMTNGGTLEIRARELEDEVEISVADTGSGIPSEHMEKIFDPFFTTKEKGTGLGLAVSYNIVKSYQGDILVENRPEGGTMFRVRLPYYES